MKLKSSNCKTIGETCQFERKILQLQSPLTLEKLGLMACKSCRVANLEKLPKFSSSHSLLPLINETQPGSAKKTETKTVTGYYHHMLLNLYQIEPECQPLPDESFLERNGLMK